MVLSKQPLETHVTMETTSLMTDVQPNVRLKQDSLVLDLLLFVHLFVGMGFWSLVMRIVTMGSMEYLLDVNQDV